MPAIDAATTSRGGPRLTGAVRIFDAEPDLMAGLGPREAEFLRRRAVARSLLIDPGPWTPPSPPEPERLLGLVVIEGLLLRTVELDGRSCPELVGAGDLIRPWDGADDGFTDHATWTALEPTEMAVLDESFATIAARWPTIVGQLLARTVQRTRSLAICLAIAHVRSASLRVHLLLWHLADRWGHVTPQGVHLPLALTHEVIGQLACIRRPTASSALAQLARDGELRRMPDGTWLLASERPTPDEDAATDARSPRGQSG